MYKKETEFLINGGEEKLRFEKQGFKSKEGRGLNMRMV